MYRSDGLTEAMAEGVSWICSLQGGSNSPYFAGEVMLMLSKYVHRLFGIQSMLRHISTRRILQQGPKSLRVIVICLGRVAWERLDRVVSLDICWVVRLYSHDINALESSANP